MSLYLRLVLLSVLLASASCFESSTNVCDGTGVVCPIGTVCTEDGTSCRSPNALCGNGVMDSGEACDDGNVLAHDGCSATCHSTEQCGNGVVDVDMPSNRDDNPALCLDATATGTGCREECDWGPGQYVPGMGCSPNCLSDESCGNGILDDHLPQSAPLPPIPPHLCLDGETTATGCKEVCDDGNLLAGDNCSPNCLSVERCGNGITDPGEACDDGDTDDSSGCRNDCMSSASCGDGVVSMGEECDDAGQTVRCDGPAATPTSERCTARVCGDGYVNGTAGMTPGGDPVPGEECDPSDIGVNTTTCDRDCTNPVCGDNLTNMAANEQCDDGPALVNGDGCSGTCQLEPYSIGILKAGNGAGTVTSGDGRVNCGADCFEVYQLGALVTLTATPAAKSTFDTSAGPSSGWSGCDTILPDGRCQVTMMTARAVTATFPLNKLTVTRDGAGTGTVTATGINCGSDCEEDYDVNTVVTLTAAPDAATSELEGWSEPSCLDTSLTCDVTMTRARSVTATFRRRTFTLMVVLPGTGDGTVTVNSTTTGQTFNCVADCMLNFLAGENLVLFGVAQPNSDFTGWNGSGCSGTANCPIVMSTSRMVSADFTLKTFTLTVNRVGNGTGTIATVPPGGINCGADCNEIYDIGTPVQLQATAAAGSRFVRWTGDCSGTDPNACSVVMAVARAVTGEFIQIFTLTVTKTGNGTVTSNPAGINCGADCNEVYDNGTAVVLTATPDAGWRFDAWTGCASTNGDTCNVTMSAARNVNATFVQTHVLTVTKSGAGAGTVTSTDGRINCGTGAGCTADYDINTMVSLNPAAQAGSRFTGWTGCTSVSGSTCNVTMSAARNVTATFELEHILSVMRIGTGTVTSAPAGINCGSDCAEPYLAGATVTLTATLTAGHRFVGWTGPCVVGGDPLVCTATMDAAKSVTAEFRAVFGLTVMKVGNGTVTSAPAGINCGATCNATYDTGTEVTLTAVEDAGWRFGGWSGATGCGTSGPCTVTMTQARTVTATFVRVHVVTVTKTGSGTGSVNAAPAGNAPGITTANCGAGVTPCSASFDQGTAIVLTATPAADSRVVAWTGDCSSTTTTTCTINSIAAARNVSVQFASSYTVTVARNGTGSGTVTSSPTGISCGNDCSEVYDGGTMITLTAVPSSEDAFVLWSGVAGCSTDITPPYTCTFTLSANTNVVATFDDNTLSVNTTGAGTGTVTSSSHAGTSPINCTNDTGNCEENYTQPTTVTLTATAAAGSRFLGWTGCTPQMADPLKCDITMNGPATVNAEFRSTQQLTIAKTTSPAGATLTAAQTTDPPPPPDLVCGTACTLTQARFDDGSTVVITAVAEPGFVLGAWTGCASSTATTCTVSMTATRSVSIDVTPMM